jgi:nucleotide-binding universal stress UspA family protein
MGKVLVPLDGSARAAAVLPTAAAFARAMGCELLLLQVVVPEGTAVSRVAADREWREGQARAEAYLEQVADSIRGPDLPVAVTITSGHPATGIVQTVHHDPLITRIVMATHGRSGVSRLVFGSTAEEVLGAAGVPVLLMRDGQTLPPLTAGCTILVPLDGSAFARQALYEAQAVATAVGARLLLVSVLPPAATSATAEAGPLPGWAVDEQQREGNRITRELEQTARQLAATGLPVDLDVEHGRPAEEIARLAATAGATLIVMATHGRSGAFPIHWGSVALAVLRQAGVPVLLRAVARPRARGAQDLGLNVPLSL